MDINDLLYENKISKVPVPGELLISEPLMNDAFFSRAVALILDAPPSGGQLALMLNKSTKATLKDLMPDWEKGGNIPVYCGGPVDMERMFFLHRLKDIFGSSHEIIPGLYVGADIDKIVEFIEDGGNMEGSFRFFLGYCGWSEGQLKNELSNNIWTVNKNPKIDRLLKGEGLEYWRREVKDLGEKYRSWLMVPPDPSFN